jgi:hypothetical protein
MLVKSEPARPLAKGFLCEHAMEIAYAVVPLKASIEAKTVTRLSPLTAKEKRT